MKEIALCGAGNKGSELYHFLKYITEELNCARIIAVIDRNKNRLGEMRVSRPEMISELNQETLFIITPESEGIRGYYKNLLQGRSFVLYDKNFDMSEILGIDRTTLNREWCAFYHIDGMNEYFMV